MPKGAVKLLLNLALLAGDALVRGGRLDVGAERGEGEIEIAVRAEGPRILLDPALRETLANGGEGTIEPRAAGAGWRISLVAEAGGSIQLPTRRATIADDRRRLCPDSDRDNARINSCPA